MSPRPTLNAKRPVRWLPSVNVGPADVQTLLNTLHPTSPLRMRLAKAFDQAKAKADHLNALDRSGVATTTTEHAAL